MRLQQIMGIVLSLVGLILFIVGLTASGAISERLVSFFTGHFTDTSVWLMLGGLISAAAGVILYMFVGRMAPD